MWCLWLWELIHIVQVSGGLVAKLYPTLVTPWTATHQASMSFTISQALLKLISIELVMPFNHLIICHPLLLLPSNFPRITVFSNKSALCNSGQSIGASASASVFPMNIQGWFPLGLSGFISLLSRDSAESSPALQFKGINSSVLSLFFYHPALIPLLYSGNLNLKWSPFIFKEYLQFWDSRICDTNLCFFSMTIILL